MPDNALAYQAYALDICQSLLSLWISVGVLKLMQ